MMVWNLNLLFLDFVLYLYFVGWLKVVIIGGGLIVLVFVIFLVEKG